MEKIREKVLSGGRLTGEDALVLFESPDIFTLGSLAAGAARRRNGNRAFYVRNVHVNPTNICVNRCRFCAFSRSRDEEGAYELSIPEVLARIEAAMPVSEVHIVGGLHPDWPFEHYLHMLQSIRRAFPSLHIKAFTAAEVDYMHRISGLSLDAVLLGLRESGLGSMPGGGAEIFSPEVRGRLCPEKLTGQRWLEVMEAAHQAGVRTNATMLYGHVESAAHRVEHLLALRELQDRTGGFQAFIPLAYHPGGTDVGRGPSGLDDLRTIAVSRLVLDNFAHIKAYWVMLGEKISQVALLFGADDLDGTVIEEKITYAAGAGSRRSITEDELVALIGKAGREPVERDSFYRAVAA
ncbi:MAG: aminofutalosine synthase MqnE [Nitrospirota bacterium]|jgi:aminodeoxyfutalosine synthase